MNKRITDIIYDLSKNPCTISDFESKFSVSARTIRNDLSQINELLLENNLEKLTLIKGGNITVPEGFEILSQTTVQDDFYTYKLSKDERIKVATSILVSSSEYVTLATIAESLFVSRATIIKDLDDIKDFIKRNNLQLISNNNKGLRVQGSESFKRRFLLKLAYSNGENQDIISKYISVQNGHHTTISKILSEQEFLHKSFLTDDSFERISTYLGIMINRNADGNFIENSPRAHADKYLMAQDILKYICQYCNISVNEDEVHFLSYLLVTSHFIKKDADQKDSLKNQMITRQFIDSISEELSLNLNDDYDFFENLSNHLQSVITMTPPEYPENDIIDSLILENSDIFDLVKRNLPIINRHIERIISDTEINYIVVHVCAAMERKKNNEIAFQIIVACNSGYGTSRLLLEKLKKHFNFQIVDIISSHEAEYLEENRADLIISTVPIKKCKIDHIVVSPLLNDEDYLRVGNKIDTLRNSRHLPSRIDDNEFTVNGLLLKLEPVINDIAPEKSKELIREIRRTVRSYYKQTLQVDTDIFSPHLHHLLPKMHIKLDVLCENWQDAVAKSAEVLLENSYVEQQYIDAMIENISENGPYVVISQGFAVPHASIELGTNKVGMSLIRLKNPIPFGAEEFDPVEFVCCLSAVDHKMHLKAFFNLVNMLQEPSFKESLRNCKTTEEAAYIIEQYEYSLLK